MSVLLAVQRLHRARVLNGLGGHARGLLGSLKIAKISGKSIKIPWENLKVPHATTLQVIGHGRLEDDEDDGSGQTDGGHVPAETGGGAEN